MKVTFIEEIEAHKAWRYIMSCPLCNEFKYKIHHQLEPQTSSCWWLECENCGYTSYPSPSREIAITRWQRAHSTNQC